MQKYVTSIEGPRTRVYQVRKCNFSNLISKCSEKCALFSDRVYHVMFCTYYSPEGEMCYNTMDHAWVARCRLYNVHWSLSWLAASWAI